MVLLSLVIYSFSLVTTTLEEMEGSKTACVPIIKWLYLVKTMALLDSILAIIIPFLLILISNMLIGYRLVNYSQSDCLFRRVTRKFFRVPSVNSPSGPKKNRLLHDTKSDWSCDETMKNVSKLRRPRKITKITRILFTISTTFLVLNLPIACSKIWHYVKSYHFIYTNQVLHKYANESALNASFHIMMTVTAALEKEPVQTETEEIFERIACYLYYLNFAINFFMYTLSESQFSDKFMCFFSKINKHHSQRAQRSLSAVRSKPNTYNVTIL